MESYLATLSLEDMQNQGERSINSSGTIGRNQNAVRLPKLEVKKFCGDPTLWPEFLDTFNVVINENNDLSDIERFTYLKGYVPGEAARCIEGLTLTATNYDETLNLLKARFVNKKTNYFQTHGRITWIRESEFISIDK